MSLRISFELSDSDLDHFHQVMRRVCANANGAGREKIIANAQQLLETINQSDATDFIRDRMGQLEILVRMLVDSDWGLADDDYGRVIAALSYFSEREDLIPDDTPMLGFLDDVIMVEIICDELEHEIQAYKEFVTYRNSAAEDPAQNAPSLQKSDWLEERRQQLHARMRRRREGRSGRRESKSPFSLF